MYDPNDFSGYKGHIASVDLFDTYGGCEEKYPPKPRRTLSQIRAFDESLWERIQQAIDYFFYLKLAEDGEFSSIARENGMEYAKELFEKMFDLGVYSLGFVDTDYVEEPYVIWLWWIGGIYSEVSRYIRTAKSDRV